MRDMSCAILNDCQDVARSYADGTVLSDVDADVLTEHVADEEALVDALGAVETLVLSRCPSTTGSDPRVLATPHLGYLTGGQLPALLHPGGRRCQGLARRLPGRGAHLSAQSRSHRSLASQRTGIPCPCRASQWPTSAGIPG